MPAIADGMTLGGVIAILALPRSLDRDRRNHMADLTERMARLEGLFEGFVGGQRRPHAEWRSCFILPGSTARQNNAHRANRFGPRGRPPRQDGVRILGREC